MFALFAIDEHRIGFGPHGGQIVDFESTPAHRNEARVMPADAYIRYAHVVATMPADHDLGRAIMDGFLDPSGEASGASERPQNALGSV